MTVLLRLAGVLVVVGAALVPGRAGAAPGRVAESITKTPGTLSAVSADSPTDAWAVGVSACNCTSLALHWNGTRWTPVNVPRQKEGELNAVSALSASDAWAVGSVSPGENTQTVALRWNGTQWSQVPTPSPGVKPVVDGLIGVSAVSPSDAWAVGSYHHIGGRYFGALMLHWDGTRWTRVAVPHPRQADLFAVSALSSTDAWAVGDYVTKSLQTQTLVLHWDGTRWARVPSPSPGPGGGVLNAVSTVSPTEAWAVGDYPGSGVGVYKSLVLRWNGTAWTRVPSPSPAGSSRESFSNLYAVSALSPSAAWAVGTYGRQVRHGGSQPLILRWNGTAWTRTASPPLGVTTSGLSGMTAISPTDAWAVGYRGGPPVLILRWNGSSWIRS